MNVNTQNRLLVIGHATLPMWIMLVICLLVLSPIEIGLAQSQPSTVLLRLDSVRLDRVDDLTGDDPYFCIVHFRSTPGSPGSTQVGVTDCFDDNWALDSPEGRQIAIPGRMGSVLFDNVRLVSPSEVVAGVQPEIIGAVVIAMESDGTPFSSVRDNMRLVQTTLHNQLISIVEPMSFLKIQANLSRIQERVRKALTDALEPDIWDIIWGVLESGFNPDELIGARHVFVIPAVDTDDSCEDLTSTKTIVHVCPLEDNTFDLRFFERGDEDWTVTAHLTAQCVAPPGPAGTVPLYGWWDRVRMDNAALTAPSWAGCPGAFRSPNYGFARVEGYVFDPRQPQPPGTVPIYHWFSPEEPGNPQNADNMLTSLPAWSTDEPTKSPDYIHGRIEGYVFDPRQPQPPGTVPLYLWYDKVRKDNFTTTHEGWIPAGPGDERSPNYAAPNSALMGYIYPP